jgi:membrane protein DedA with SNARE-associated domain
MIVGTEATAAAYLTLFLLLLLSWAGLPAAGQPALVAAGVFAGRDQIELVPMLAVTVAGSALGGVAGYWIGRHAGRAVWTAPGPVRRWRVRGLACGELLVERHGPVAVLLTPTWVSGVARMAWPRFAVWNVLAAVAWTLVAALGGYWLGPPMANALGLLNGALVVAGATIVAFTLAHFVRRARHMDDGR